MKKFYLLLALLVAVNVQFSEALPYRLSNNLKTLQFSNEINNVDYGPIQIDNKSNQIQELSYTLLDTLVNATNAYWSFVNPLTYEPNLNIYYYASVIRNNTFPSTNLNIKHSTNGGTNWINTGVSFTNPTEVMAFPNISVVKKSEGPNSPTNAYFYIFNSPYRNNNNSYTLAGGQYILSDGEQTVKEDVISPIDNNTGFNYYYGNSTSLATHNRGDESIVYITNQLDPVVNDVDQYGQYGSISFNFAEFSSTTTIPRSWYPDKFRAPGGLSNSFNAFQQVDVDNLGTAYVGVYNIFPNDETTRIPGVSKSTDNGKTWSEFSTMPANLIDSYSDIINDPTASIFFRGGLYPYAYTVEGFSVLGENNYSFFTKLLVNKDAETNTIEEMHLVEINFNGTNWSIRKITNLNINDLPDQIVDLNVNDGAYQKRIMTSSLGNEIQSSITSDGEYVLLKWIDMNEAEIPLTRPDTLYSIGTNPNTGVEETQTNIVDKMRTTDIYISYRKVNEFTWSKPINVTNDNIYDKGTFIPKRVADLSNIALIKSYNTPGTYQNGLSTQDPVIGQRIIDRQQNMLGTKINLNDPNLSVETREENKFDFRLNEIYPNPALNGSVEITFSSENTQNGRLELYDALGNKIQTIYSGVIENTIQGMNFSTVNLNNGVYFVTLTIGDKSVTKKFNVLN